MEKFIFEETSLKGLYHITPKPITDNRGYFERLYCENDFAEIGLTKKIVNINHSYTKNKGIIRGLHFQFPPLTETKIVICLKGAIFDVAVDIRKGSATFLKYHSQVLTAEKRNMLLIKEGFAHGFQTLRDDSELLYLHTNFYSRELEGGLFYGDPMLGISWELEPADLSERDKKHPLIDENFKGI